jgi:hypothetical protein
MEQDERIRRVRERLIEAARSGELVYYGEFIRGDYGVARGQGSRWKIGDVLDEINHREAAENRPLLSAICVLEYTGMPSVGFWEMDLIPPGIRGGSWAQQRQFWESARDDVFNHPY